jgi:hypothetical protein
MISRFQLNPATDEERLPLVGSISLAFGDFEKFESQPQEWDEFRN